MPDEVSSRYKLSTTVPFLALSMTPEQELEHLQSATHKGIAAYLAMRVRRERIRNGYSQAAFAEKAGIALRTYKRFELSGVGSVETLTRILIAMGHARGFYTLFPHPQPIAKMNLTERIRAISVGLTGPFDDKVCDAPGQVTPSSEQFDNVSVDVGRSKNP